MSGPVARIGGAATGRPTAVALALALVVLLVAVPSDVRAGTPTRASGLAGVSLGRIGQDRAATSDPRALRQMQRAATATDRVAYTGVQFVSGWSSVGAASTVVDVANMPSTGTALRIRGSGSGGASATFVSAGGTLDAGVGGGVRATTVSLLVENYAVHLAGTTSTAGRKAKVVDVRATDGAVAARFWIDKRTGVMLRREVYDASGRTTRASAFVTIHIGAKRLPDHVPPAVVSTVAQPLDSQQVATLRTGGWDCPDEVAGSLTLLDVRTFQADGLALHLTYSDGLSTVSVFQQRGTLDTARMQGYTAMDVARLSADTGTAATDATVYVRAGIPEQIVWSADGIVYTVLADAPQAAVASVVSSLPHAATGDAGVVDRVARGLSRVGSWLNPFA